MFFVSREFSFCYGHRLLGHPGKCCHPHGHNGRAVITLSMPELNESGMVVDFTDLKETVGRWIDENLDHKMILAAADPLLPLLKGLGEPVFVTDENPTAETLAKLLFDAAASKKIPVVRVEFWETPACRAVYEKE
ncbi:MAG: 6-carboxytetrahydropterin synthase [Thermoguttaceae bacterium]|nr:6-carboxytetrahydropterin synthase [Thermoguttaceae bacterium]